MQEKWQPRNNRFLNDPSTTEPSFNEIIDLLQGICDQTDDSDLEMSLTDILLALAKEMRSINKRVDRLDHRLERLDSECRNYSP